MRKKKNHSLQKKSASNKSAQPKPRSPSKKRTPSKKKAPLPPPTATLQSQFSSVQLRQQFRKLLTQSLMKSWLGPAAGGFYQRLFTPLITLWYVVFQRLSKDHSLDKVVANARWGGANALSPRGKPLSARIKSQQSTSFSDARQRLPLAVFQQALAHCAQQIRGWVENSAWKGWQVILLDGSTVRLPSLGDIPQTFRPHRNSHGTSYWCLMRVVVGFCLCTGVAVSTAMGATTLSEQAMALPLLAELHAQSLVVADRNFGIFAIAQAAVSAKAQVVVRMTKQRARKLARSNGFKLYPGLDEWVDWTASKRDTYCPKGPKTLAGRLIAVRIQRPGCRAQELYIFTTLRDAQLYSVQALLDLYGQRWQVELFLRHVKDQMDLGALNCKSAEMARKEWVAGLLAYNLVRSLMVAAATHANISIRQLSFARVRTQLLFWIQKCDWQSQGAAMKWSMLVEFAAECVHSKRRKPRPAEPRAVRHYKQDFPALKGDRAAAREKLNLKS